MTRQPKHAKKSLRDIFGLKAAIETRRYGLGAVLFSCLVLNKVKPDNMDTAGTVSDRMVREAYPA
jgi:hypothetical protein